MIMNSMEHDNLVSIDFFRLKDVLLKMVRTGLLSQVEREELLRKAGLLKLEDGRWRESENTILTLFNE